jgi:N-acetylglucosamine kinase-like BadF-type ATPase
MSASRGDGAAPSGPDGEVALVAVDGGNSKTDAVAVDRTGRVLGYASGPSTCHQFVGMPAAMDNLERTVHEALASAGWTDPVDRPAPGLGVYCLAGLDLPIDEERLGRALDERRLTERFLLYNDTTAILRAGTRESWGLGLVCGTGINCVAVAPDGRTIRYPALGELSGDFTTGGSWLGTRALGLALRAEDGRGPDTCLTATVPAGVGLPDARAVLEAVYSGELPYARLAPLAPLVFDAAAAGESPAREAVELVADELVRMASAAIRRLQLETLPLEVVLGGGVFETHYGAFVERIRAGILAGAPLASFVRLPGPPVTGAAMLGLEALGVATEASRGLLHRSLDDRRVAARATRRGAAGTAR